MIEIEGLPGWGSGGSGQGGLPGLLWAWTGSGLAAEKVSSQELRVLRRVRGPWQSGDCGAGSQPHPGAHTLPVGSQELEMVLASSGGLK